MFKTSRFAFKHPSQKFSQKSIKQPVSSQKKLIVLLKKLLSANFIHKIKSFPKALLFYFFNSTWHTPDLKLQNLMPFNNYKLRVWASEPHTMLIREDKTIEIAVPFPAPEKGDNRGLSPFHPRIIIVIGECPLLPPVWKSSPLPRKPLKCLENLPPSPSPVTGAGTGKGTPSFNV